MSPPVIFSRVDMKCIELYSKFVFHCGEENFSSRYGRIWILVTTVLTACLSKVAIISLRSELGKFASEI
jgi:hypothetical protein